MSRIALLCPGRGSYTEKSLGSLPKGHAWVQQADAIRAEFELEPAAELDAAGKFEPARHLRPANVSALIYLCTMLDGKQALEQHEVTCILGNSMGWYTALALAGSLSFEDGFRLVQVMALLQEEIQGGGQIIYPLVNEAWERVEEQAEAVAQAVAKPADGSPPEVYPSIHLGGYEVLAGTSAGVSHLLKHLPKVKLGKVVYPFRLAGHGPYHTPLVSAVTKLAQRRLYDLEFETPKVCLIDGRGRRHSPWSAHSEELRNYTFGAQVDTPYDFTKSVAVALKEHAPELLWMLGPGNTLGGVAGQILIELGWRGIHSRADFSALQDSEQPILHSVVR